MACLDTTVFIDLRARSGKPHHAAAVRIVRQTLAGATCCTTRFNVAEMNVGIHKSVDPVHEKNAVAAALQNVPVLEFDEPAAELFGQLRAYLESQGTPIADMDLLIASVALRNNEPLVTRNGRHFIRIPGLTVITY